MKRVHLAVSLLAILSFGCAAQQPVQQAPATPPDTRAADEAAIKATEAKWAKVANADEWVTFYADGAVVLPPNAPAATNKEDIKKVFTELMGQPGFAITFQSTKIEVARSGDLASSWGTYEITVNDAKGKPMKDTGKFITVWRKQGADWKAIQDTFNSDLPAQPAPPAAGKK